MKIRIISPKENDEWDNYVRNHPLAAYCHLFEWQNVIQKTYGHKSYYLAAEHHSKIVGILPLIEIKSLLFGHGLVSMPFLNYGGYLADSAEIAVALIEQAHDIKKRTKSSYMELRLLTGMDAQPDIEKFHYGVNTHKVRMLMEFPGTSEQLFQSFKAKLRSQIRRPGKEGMKAVIGGKELLEDYYTVFSENMRDLGSPVHSKNLFVSILDRFDQAVKICVVYYENLPVASGMIFCFRDTVEIPWASSLKKYNRYSPNMLLYWSLIKYSCDEGFKYFDFGRSTMNESTFRFKKQWGAEPHPLYWYTFSETSTESINENEEGIMQRLAVPIWQRIPLFLANYFGPKIRGFIPL